MSAKGKAAAPAEPRYRLDRWLWAARFFKTRALAHEAVEGGKVTYNGLRCKPGREVEIGARLCIRIQHIERTIIVRDLSLRRGPASVATLLYEETPESVAARDLQADRRRALNTTLMPPARRPRKKERRQLDRLREINRGNSSP